MPLHLCRFKVRLITHTSRIKATYENDISVLRFAMPKSSAMNVIPISYELTLRLRGRITPSRKPFLSKP